MLKANSSAADIELRAGAGREVGGACDVRQRVCFALEIRRHRSRISLVCFLKGNAGPQGLMTRYSPPQFAAAALYAGAWERAPSLRPKTLLQFCRLTGVINLLAFIPVRGGAEAICSIHLS